MIRTEMVKLYCKIPEQRKWQWDFHANKISSHIGMECNW